MDEYKNVLDDFAQYSKDHVNVNPNSASLTTSSFTPNQSVNSNDNKEKQSEDFVAFNEYIYDFNKQTFV